MIQLLRDADHTRRSLEVSHSTSRDTACCLHGGWMPDGWIPVRGMHDNRMHDSRPSVTATWSEIARSCRGLQDLNAQNHGPDDQSPPCRDAQNRNAQNRGLCTCGPSAASAQHAKSNRRLWKAPTGPSFGIKRRQFGATTPGEGDNWQQQTTIFRPRNSGRRGCPTRPDNGCGAAPSAGSQLRNKIYGEHGLDGIAHNPLTLADRTASTGPKPL